MNRDTKELREAIAHWEREAQGNDEYAPLVRWLTELLHLRGDPNTDAMKRTYGSIE